MKVTRLTLLAVAASAMLSSANFAWSQAAWPTKPIRVVLPNGAGSPIDAIARRMGEMLSKSHGWTWIVDNKPGAVGTIGAAEVSRAPADGHTLLFCVSDPLVAASAMVKSMPYDPLKSFVPLSKVARSPAVLVANPRVKANSVAELIADMKAQGASPSYGSWGPGTIPMQVMESAARQAGVKFREVPYRTSPAALQDMLGGTIDLAFTAPFIVAPMVAEGKMKAIGMVSVKRSTVLPNVPTFAEAGFKSYVFTNEIWIGLLAPAGLDPNVREKIVTAVRELAQGQELGAFLGKIGFVSIGSTPAEFERELREEIAAIPPLLRELGLQPQ